MCIYLRMYECVQVRHAPRSANVLPAGKRDTLRPIDPADPLSLLQQFTRRVRLCRPLNPDKSQCASLPAAGDYHKIRRMPASSLTTLLGCAAREGGRVWGLGGLHGCALLREHVGAADGRRPGVCLDGGGGGPGAQGVQPRANGGWLARRATPSEQRVVLLHAGAPSLRRGFSPSSSTSVFSSLWTYVRPW